ncbi:HIT family protein [Dactylosporangium sp. CA-233914]|uniref:HIT family protein n=1 Tax=Dactylosporangium sp. CA-233914 TaxID=3239934 RepID=UPI003D91BA5B
MDWRADRLRSAERGENPTVIARMRTGWAVIGDSQYLPGYCLLLHGGDAKGLTDLPLPEQMLFLRDMALLGQAVQGACSKLDTEFWRINYAILGNTWEHLHAHVQARYRWEPEQYRTGPVWNYGSVRNAGEHRLGPRHDVLRATITQDLRRLMSEACD